MPAARPRTRILINGVEVSSPRAVGNVLPTKATLRNLDGPDEFEFVERGTLVPTYPYGSRVAVDVAFDRDEDGTLVEGDYTRRFTGLILGGPRTTAPAFRVDYRCVGIEYLADDVRVTHPQSGKSEVAFNLPPSDPLYEEENARLSFGGICLRLLTYDQHATDLWLIGIEAYTQPPPLIDPLNPALGRRYNTPAGSPPVLKSATLADLAVLSLIPFGEVRFSGAKLWQQIRNAAEDAMPSIAPKIEADGTIRFYDTRSPEWVELRIGTDPVEPPSLSHDVGDTCGAVLVVGDDQVEGRTYQSQAQSGIPAQIAADWLSSDQAVWKITDHTIKTNNRSSGTIPANGLGPTTVVVRPTDGATAWAANKWANDRATIEIVLPIGNGSELVVPRRVLSNTACAPGGTSTISLDEPIGVTGYTHFRLTGQSDNPRRFVWRRYRFLDPSVASRIVDRFPFPVLWEFRGGAEYVDTPVGKQFRRDTPNSNPRETDLSFDLFRDSDGIVKILTREPVVSFWSTPAELEAGGASVKAPDNVLVFVPVSQGVLSVRRPATGWAGEAETNPYLRRTKIVTLTDWRFAGDTQRMSDYADSLLDVFKRPAISGGLNYFGLWRQGVETPNAAVKLTSDFGATPWESEKLNVRAVEVVWTGAPTSFATRLRLSTQRRPWAGDRQFEPASYSEGGPLSNAPALDARGVG
jgi:hypothetical protein